MATPTNKKKRCSTVKGSNQNANKLGNETTLLNPPVFQNVWQKRGF
jgi:hypothetical protein